MAAAAGWSSETGSLDFGALQSGYREGALSPPRVVEAVYERIARRGEDNVWIHLIPREAALERARPLEAAHAAAGGPPDGMPLFGLPFALKDNIDAAGAPTTAGCPEYAYTPEKSAPAAARLIEAGAILIGKTNLDQFATGLVGVRTPYGVPGNALDPRYIPGGSSSGSAVAVAAGLVSFALGTDTAGSGRVPAGFNNIVGLKPTRGLVSISGVVPACRSLDCVSVLALTCADALAALRVMAAEDAADIYSRPAPEGSSLEMPAGTPSGIRVGAPRGDQLAFFGNADAERLFAGALERLAGMGAAVSEIDFGPFREAADLLYGGPWMAERLWAIREFLETRPEAVHPVTRDLIEGAKRYSAVDAFDAMYRLEALRREALREWEGEGGGMDVLAVPTTGTIYTIEEVQENQLSLNTNLSYYTNFVNLLDLSALAVPNGFQGNGLPAGVTLIAPAFRDGLLCALGAEFHRRADVPLGATQNALPG